MKQLISRQNKSSMQNLIKYQLSRQFKSSKREKKKSQRSLSLSKLDIAEVLTLKQVYESKIMKPIAVIEALQAQKMPQKCLIHGIDYTLYCNFDKKPLCVNCVQRYNNKHIGHKVTPLKNSAQSVKNDITKFKKSLTSIKQETGQKISLINIDISKIDEKLEATQEKINEHFQKMHAILNQQQEQLQQQYQFQCKKIKYKLIVLSGNLKKINDHICLKFQKYDNQQVSSSLVSRNVLEILQSSSKLIEKQLKNFNYQSYLEINDKYFTEQINCLNKLTEYVKKIGKNNDVTKNFVNSRIDDSQQKTSQKRVISRSPTFVRPIKKKSSRSVSSISYSFL